MFKITTFVKYLQESFIISVYKAISWGPNTMCRQMQLGSQCTTYKKEKIIRSGPSVGQNESLLLAPKHFQRRDNNCYIETITCGMKKFFPGFAEIPRESRPEENPQVHLSRRGNLRRYGVSCVRESTPSGSPSSVIYDVFAEKWKRFSSCCTGLGSSLECTSKGVGGLTWNKSWWHG